MASVHPQDTVDVPLAARRSASYDCEFILDDVHPCRLAAAVDVLIGLEARFQLTLDDHGRPRIEGRAKARVKMPCQRCLEGVEIDVGADLGSVIWFGDEPPAEWADFDCDVIVSESSEMTFAALIEDDLLLALPQQVCRVSDCPRLPVLTYPAEGYTAGSRQAGKARKAGEDALNGPEGQVNDDLADDRQRPFAGLKELLDGQTDD